MNLVDLSVIAGSILTVLGTGLGTAKYRGKWEQRVSSIEANDLSNNSELKDVNTKLDKLSELLQRIEVALFGWDGSNGMRGQIKELQGDVKDLKESLAGKQDMK